LAIYAFLEGELPPRHLPDVDEDTPVERAQEVVQEVFSADSSWRAVLSFNGVELADPQALLKKYGIPSEALINARPE
jgi:hypothetical protein